MISADSKLSAIGSTEEQEDSFFFSISLSCFLEDWSRTPDVRDVLSLDWNLKDPKVWGDAERRVHKSPALAHGPSMAKFDIVVTISSQSLCRYLEISPSACLNHCEGEQGYTCQLHEDLVHNYAPLSPSTSQVCGSKQTYHSPTRTIIFWKKNENRKYQDIILTRLCVENKGSCLSVDRVWDCFNKYGPNLPALNQTNNSFFTQENLELQIRALGLQVNLRETQRA